MYELKRTMPANEFVSPKHLQSILQYVKVQNTIFISYGLTMQIISNYITEEKTQVCRGTELSNKSIKY